MEYTVHDLAALMGTNEYTVRRRIRSLIKYYNIPFERVMRLRNGSYQYVLDEELVEVLLRDFSPKIHIEVKV